MSSNSINLYLEDLVNLIKEKALNAKIELYEIKKDQIFDKSYQIGYLMAYHEVISLMKTQADAFKISYTELNLDNIDPNIDLI